MRHVRTYVLSFTLCIPVRGDSLWKDMELPQGLLVILLHLMLLGPANNGSGDTDYTSHTHPSPLPLATPTLQPSL